MNDQNDQLYAAAAADNLKTLPDFLDNAAARWPDRTAYRWFDRQKNSWAAFTWKEFAAEVKLWQKALKASGLKKGDRIAVLLTNSIQAILADQAILANGLVPVPLHAIDTPSACAFVLENSEASAILVASEARWNAIVSAAAGEKSDLSRLQHVVFVHDTPKEELPEAVPSRLSLAAWLARGADAETDPADRPAASDLAAIIYTSGTTGRPKGVMLPHSAVVGNTKQTAIVLPITEEDVYFSYLPLSHAFERTVAYYHSMYRGAELVIARSVMTVAEDLQTARPTIMNTVPRVLERFHTAFVNATEAKGETAAKELLWAQEVGWRRFCRANDLPVEHSPREELDDTAWPELNEKIGSQVRAIFGGRIRNIISGGAALNYAIAKFFCSMDINLRQGYGLTEASPVISVSETVGNHPATVGSPLPGTEAKLSENDELLVRGDQVMAGYWKRPEATRDAFTADGFLRTGDQADLSDGGRIRIKGRIKEIIVTSTGEKIPPVDLEHAIQEDPLFEQVMIVGEGRPFIAVLAVVNPEQWKTFCSEQKLDPEDPSSYKNHTAERAALLRIRRLTKNFPQYGAPRAILLLSEHWTPDNGMTTSTMKLRRPIVTQRYLQQIEELYQNSKA